jgi:hypothetical protein
LFQKMQQNICKPTSVLYFYKVIGQQPENSILKLEQIIYEKKQADSGTDKIPKQTLRFS